MFKFVRRCLVLALLCGAFWLGGVARDMHSLQEDVIRLHVVAASDSEEDQAVKLRIRDAVIEELSDALAGLEGVEAAKEYLADHLSEIRQVAQQVLADSGSEETVTVSLTEEAFDTRVYDTFTLPAGVYEALRIVIGEGEGQNWWCVVFPSLCLPDTADDFASVAVSAGFSERLTATVSNEYGYTIRFFVLEQLGKLQNLFFQG